MRLRTLLANLSCRDIAVSEGWYERLFNRPATARPMDGLVEWHLDDARGMQLFLDAEKAGGGTLTLIIDNLDVELDRLQPELVPASVSPGGGRRVAQFNDPDGNLVVLVEG